MKHVILIFLCFSIVLLNMASGKWSADLIMGFYKWKVLKIVEDAQVEPIPENIFMIFQELLSEEKSAKTVSYTHL